MLNVHDVQLPPGRRMEALIQVGLDGAKLKHNLEARAQGSAEKSIALGVQKRARKGAWRE